MNVVIVTNRKEGTMNVLPGIREFFAARRRRRRRMEAYLRFLDLPPEIRADIRWSEPEEAGRPCGSETEAKRGSRAAKYEGNRRAAEAAHGRRVVAARFQEMER